MAPHATARYEDDEERLVTVLVTGFGPFQEQYPVNPSFEIARSLPQLLPRSATDCDAVQVISYDTPIRVCYDDARELVPAVLESYSQTVDLVLHIGMASGRQYYTAERYAHREGYGKHKDLDGKVPPDDEAERLFDDCPAQLETSLSFDDVVAGWQSSIEHAPEGSALYKVDARSSEDAGNYLCDYTYFNSLAWHGRRHKKLQGGNSADRPVLFLHVPAESDDEMLDKGRAVAVALIRAMVDVYVGARAQKVEGDGLNGLAR